MAPTPSDPAVTAGPAAQRPGRLSGLPALLLVVGIWAFAGVATIAITVHAGDVVAGGLCALAALAATIEVLRHR
jgi:hypothetical protein